MRACALQWSSDQGGVQSLRALVCVLCLLPAVAGAAQGAAGAHALDAFRAAQEERARAEVVELLNALCPGQCVLLSVSAQVAWERPPDALPALTAPDEDVATLRGVRAQVAVDAALAKPFRDRLQELVTQRLRGLGAPARVGVETVPFPPRRVDGEAAGAPPALPAAPQPQIITLQLPPPSSGRAGAPAPGGEDEAVAPARGLSPRERALESLATAAPWLVVAAMASATLLCALILATLALRRGPRSAAATAVHPAPSGAARKVDADGRREDAERERILRRIDLLESVARDPSGAAWVLRQALARGESRRVGLWLRELGTPLVELAANDAAQDPELVEVLCAASVDAREAAEALSNLQGRLTAARLGRAAAGASTAFDFLRGQAADRVAAALEALSPGERAVALRLCPDPVRAEVLPRLGLGERRALAVRWATQQEPAPTEVARAAEALKGALARTADTGAARAALVELVSSLPPPEQRALVAELTRVDPALASDLVVEGTLAELPGAVVARAAMQVPPGQLAGFLAAAEAEVRTAVLAALPASLQRDLEEELAHCAAPPPVEVQRARRALLRAVQDALHAAGPAATRREAS
jgi:flagellar motor switch protein FliG